MKIARICIGIAFFQFFGFGVNAQAGVIHLTFDGSTTGGWTTATFVGTDPPTDPVAISGADSSNPTGLNGIFYPDAANGLQHYVAPASLLAMDFTGMQLQFGFYIPQIPNETPSTPVEFDLITIRDGSNNEVFLTPINVTAVDTLQYVTIDFAALQGQIDPSDLVPQE